MISTLQGTWSTRLWYGATYIRNGTFYLAKRRNRNITTLTTNGTEQTSSWSPVSLTTLGRFHQHFTRGGFNLEYGNLENSCLDFNPRVFSRLPFREGEFRESRFWDSRSPYSRLITFSHFTSSFYARKVQRDIQVITVFSPFFADHKTLVKLTPAALVLQVQSCFYLNVLLRWLDLPETFNYQHSLEFLSTIPVISSLVFIIYFEVF